MKKRIAYIKTYTYYYIGDFVSRFMYMRGMSRLYYTYQWCMKRSIQIQDESGCNGPWKMPS